MSLSAALNVAQSSLTATSLQTSLISRNVAGSGDTSYTRKSGLLATGYGGTVRVASVGRAMDAVLFTAKLTATSSTATQQAIADGIAKLETTVNDPQLDHSLASQLGALTNALQQYSVTPDDPLLAQDVLSRANDLASALNAASETTADVRKQADADMATGVDRVNQLLSQFEQVNKMIVKGSQANADTTDLQDSRDKILSQLSEEIGISTVTRGNNDMVIYTDSGVTLFETVPRSVTMVPSYALAPGVSGNAVYIDGVAVTGPNAIMPLKSGQIYGSAVVRDDVAVVYQGQLDEIARGLIEAFAEKDQVPPLTGPAQAGLFTYGTAPVPPATESVMAVPATGTIANGMAASIRVNWNADPARGGDLDRLRDGGISNPADPDYVYNTGGEAGFSGRIQGILDQLGAQRAFDPATQADPTNTLSGFASSSVGWLEAKRQSGDVSLGYEKALLDRTTEALSNATGVNIDEEMTLMMELERSYSAASNIISTIDQMFDSLLSAVR